MENLSPENAVDEIGRLRQRVEALEAERDELAAEVVQSESVARNLVDASPMGVFIYRLDDADQLIFSGANAAAERHLGVGTEQFMGRTIEQAFPPLADSEVPMRYREAARDGRPWHTEQIDYEDDQITGAFEVHAFQTRPGEMAVLFFDITERKRAEEELQAYRDRLEWLVEKRSLALKTTQQQLVAAERLAVLGKFAGAIAHEIRNPLTVIANASYYLQRRLAGADEKISDQLERIDRQVARTTEIIESILKLTRPSPAVKERVDLQKLLRTCLERVEPPEAVTVAWDFPAAPPRVNADPRQLAIAVENLLRNATQAMPVGGELSLRCRAVDRGDRAGFEVSFADTGPGIPEAELGSVFEPLFTTRSFGVGLGLAIVRLIMDRHEGAAQVSSSLGAGAVFTLWIPE